MRYTMLAGKIHRATVTATNLDYEGSITIDPELLERAGIPPFAQVQIYNISNGERFETYTIVGERGSGDMALNGAAAHKASTGDLIIVACYCQLEKEGLSGHRPRLVYVDRDNRPLAEKTTPPIPR